MLITILAYDISPERYISSDFLIFTTFLTYIHDII